MAAKLILDIVGDSSSAVAALGKTESATKSAGGQAKTTSSSLAGIAKAVATGYAVKKVLDFGKSTVEAAGDAAHANKVLTATMKNAGDTTGEAAGHAIDLAESWGRATGISPTVVKGAEAILATFHTVSDETGRQSGIFDRATKAAGDLAAAGFGTMDTNAKQLGKALADPTKGMAALTKSGVNFTEAQKDQIKNMQKSGDLLGAQKVVLGEVENQVKGTAESTAGSGAKMKVAYEEMKVSIGTALLGPIGKVKTQFAGLFDFISSNSSWLVPLVMGIAGLVVGLLLVVKAVTLFKEAMVAMKAVIAGVKLAWQLLNSSFLMSPIGLIIVAVIALAAILVVLYLKVDWFRAAVNAAWDAIATGFQVAWNFLVGLFNGAVSFLQTWGTTILWVIAAPFMVVFSIIKAAVDGGWSGITAQLGQWAGNIVGILSNIVNVISAPFKAAWSAIQSGLIQPLSGAFSSVVSAITGALAGVENAITAPFKAAWDFIDQHILSPLKSAWNSVANTINAIHVSFTIPSNPITDVLHVAGKGFDWSPPFHIPTLARGGLITTTGFVYAHAGEAISPIPSRIGGRTGAAVQIEHAHFSEKIDVETFGRRLAWTIRSAGV
jgi:hypothetical protein